MWQPICKFSVAFRCHGVRDLNYIAKRPAGKPDTEHIFINKNCAIETELLIAASFHGSLSQDRWWKIEMPLRLQSAPIIVSCGTQVTTCKPIKQKKKKKVKHNMKKDTVYFEVTPCSQGQLCPYLCANINSNVQALYLLRLFKFTCVTSFYHFFINHK